MFLNSLIEELCTKEENNKAGCTLTFGGQCRICCITVSNKNIRAFEINPVRKLILILFYEINICHVLIFRFHTVFNKHEMIKILNQTTEKLLPLSQMLE